MVRLRDGSQQKDIWGANWNPLTQEVSFESLINIRPRQNNRSIEILDPNIKANVTAIVQKLIG